MLANFQRKLLFQTVVKQQRSYAGAADLKILKRRQKTVSQIGKITGVLKVVAQSRLPAAQEKAAQVQSFFHSTDKVFAPITNKLLENESELDVTTVIIYTDRGLCGPCNNGINRMLDKETLSNQHVVVWGEKGSSGFEKSKHQGKVLFSAHPNIKTPLSFLEVTNMVTKILEKDCDLYRIIFNKMSGPNNSVIDEIYLPSLSSIDMESSRELLSPYELEAVASDELLQNLNEFHLSSAINYAIFQNLAVELFQRRNSMQNATQNAKDVVHKIKLKYNKARQQIITTELGEIVSGAAAVDEMIKAR
jgi:ATP synthase F1 gamma subunit